MLAWEYGKLFVWIKIVLYLKWDDLIQSTNIDETLDITHISNTFCIVATKTRFNRVNGVSSETYSPGWNSFVAISVRNLQVRNFTRNFLVF